MSNDHEHDFGATADLLPAARQNGLRELTGRLVSMDAAICCCGEITMTVERRVGEPLTGPQWDGVAELAVDTLAVS